jgi:hypothetical protein
VWLRLQKLQWRLPLIRAKSDLVNLSGEFGKSGEKYPILDILYQTWKKRK